MFEELWSKIEKRQCIKINLLVANNVAAKNRLNEEFTAIRLRFRKLARCDRRRTADELAYRANAAGRILNIRKLYDVTVRLCNKSRPSKKLLKDNGTMDRALLQPIDSMPNQPTTVSNSLGILLNLLMIPPTYAELVAAIKELKAGKASAVEIINVELLKADMVRSAEILCPPLQRVWEMERVPCEWKQSLLMYWQKYFSTVCLQRLQKHFGRSLPGFILDAHALATSCHSSLSESYVEWRVELFLVLVNFEKTFDFVKWSAM